MHVATRQSLTRSPVGTVLMLVALKLKIICTEPKNNDGTPPSFPYPTLNRQNKAWTHNPIRSRPPSPSAALC